MLHLNNLRKHKENYIFLLNIKNFKAETLINNIINQDDERKIIQQKSDNLQYRANQIAKEIGVLYKQNNQIEADKLKKESLKVKQDLKILLERKMIL